MLELEEADAVLVFRRTKNGAAELAEKLGGRGFVAEAMHGRPWSLPLVLPPLGLLMLAPE